MYRYIQEGVSNNFSWPKDLTNCLLSFTYIWVLNQCLSNEQQMGLFPVLVALQFNQICCFEHGIYNFVKLNLLLKPWHIWLRTIQPNLSLWFDHHMYYIQLCIIESNLYLDHGIYNFVELNWTCCFDYEIYNSIHMTGNLMTTISFFENSSLNTAGKPKTSL